MKARCLLFVFFSPFLLAQVPEGYYDSVDATSAQQLRLTLHEVIDDHTFFPYTHDNTDTWDILEMADQDPNNSGNIIDIYRNASHPKQGGGNSFYNREHSWPKSYGFPEYDFDNPGENYPYSDCHHLFLSDPDYNSERSNKPFRDCSNTCLEQPTEANDGRGGGSGIFPGNSNWTSGQFSTGTWQTWSGRKGDVARAMFYMAIRYEGGVHGITGIPEPDLELTDDDSLIESSRTGFNESTAFMGILSDLLRWHAEDPVDDRERQRNEAIASFQGNRNPFIDHPEWVACLFEESCTVPAVETDRWIAHVTRSGTDFQTTLLISNTLAEAGNITLHPFDETGESLPTKSFEVPANGFVQMPIEQALESTAVSHFGITGDTTCIVATAYRVSEDKVGGSAHVPESTQSGTRFLLNQGEWDVVWDGMAVVNLSDEPATITGVRKDTDGAETFRQVIKEELSPKAKHLEAFHVFFPNEPDTQISIESDQPVAIIFLRGSQNSDTFFLYQTVPIIAQ